MQSIQWIPDLSHIFFQSSGHSFGFLLISRHYEIQSSPLVSPGCFGFPDVHTSPTWGEPVGIREQVGGLTCPVPQHRWLWELPILLYHTPFHLLTGTLDLAEPVHLQPVLETRQEALTSPFSLNMYWWKWLSGNFVCSGMYRRNFNHAHSSAGESPDVTCICLLAEALEGLVWPKTFLASQSVFNLLLKPSDLPGNLPQRNCLLHQKCFVILMFGHSGQGKQLITSLFAGTF